MPATYLDLKTRISSEMHRPDLLTSGDIAAHVLSAVAFYASNRFLGNEYQWTITTINGTKYYGAATAAPGTLPTGIADIDSIVAMVNSRVYRLQEQSFGHLEDIDAGNTTLSGYPREWAWFQNQLRLYPTPNGAYTLTISGQQILTALSADGDSNYWTTDAEQLIRARAKKTLALDVTNNEPLAKRMDLLEKEAFLNLKSEAVKLMGSGKLAATKF